MSKIRPVFLNVTSSSNLIGWHTMCEKKKPLIEKWLYLDIKAWFYIGASVCIWLNQMQVMKKKWTWRWQLTLVHFLFFVILLNLCRSEYGWEWNEHMKPPHVRPEKVSISNPSCTLTISYFTWMDLWLPKQWHWRAKKIPKLYLLLIVNKF